MYLFVILHVHVDLHGSISRNKQTTRVAHRVPSLENWGSGFIVVFCTKPCHIMKYMYMYLQLLSLTSMLLRVLLYIEKYICMYMYMCTCTCKCTLVVFDVVFSIMFVKDLQLGEKPIKSTLLTGLRYRMPFVPQLKRTNTYMYM